MLTFGGRHRWTTFLLGVMLGAAGSPGLRQGSAADGTSTGRREGEVIAVRFAGRLPNRSAEPTHTTWVGEVRAPGTGEVLGTMTHDSHPLRPGDPESAALQIVNTLELADGTIVIRAAESIVPDPLHPGYFLVGVHPDSATVVSATGVYAGRTGTARMTGRHDGRELPGHAGFDDFWLIELRSTGHGQGRSDGRL